MGSRSVKSKSGKVSVDVMKNIVTQLNTLTDDIAHLKLQAIKDLAIIADTMAAWNHRLSTVETKINANHPMTATAAQIFADNSYTPPAPHTPPTKPSIAAERNKKTFSAVKYALRMMQGISYLASETSFNIQINRSYLRRTIVVNSYNGLDFFVDCRYNDANGSPRSSRYSTLAEACADITAIVMFYAMR